MTRAESDNKGDNKARIYMNQQKLAEANTVKYPGDTISQIGWQNCNNYSSSGQTE